LRLKDHEDDQLNPGPAYPAFYSHALAGEIHTEKDLDLLTKEGFLPRIEDVSPASSGLMQALASGKAVQNVPEWAYTPNNVSASTEHFLSAATRETGKAASGASISLYVQSWLEAASELAREIRAVDRSQKLNARTSLTHQEVWRRAFATFLASY
jgi:hypothetical protein